MVSKYIQRDVKKCFTCKIEKPKAEFYPRKDSADGRQSSCIACTCERRRAWAKENYDPVKNSEQCKIFREKNSESLKEKKREYYRKNKQRKKEYDKRPEVREKKKAQDREYRLRNLEKARAHSREWQKENREKSRTIQRNRKARKRVAEGSYKPDDVERILRAQKRKCAVCRIKLPVKGYHLDHIIPLKRGGTNHPKNIQALCASCNYHKSAKDPIDFMREKGRLL